MLQQLKLNDTTLVGDAEPEAGKEEVCICMKNRIS